ncbi:MAG: hypothetical protein AB7O45_05510 [Alphaproteobacteria bacterium]
MRSAMPALAAAFLASAAAACAGPDHPSLAGGASDPAAPVPAIVAAPVFDDLSDATPAAPLPWAEVNRRVSPRAGTRP